MDVRGVSVCVELLCVSGVRRGEGSCSIEARMRGSEDCTAAMRASASRGSRLSKKGCSTCVCKF